MSMGLGMLGLGLAGRAGSAGNPTPVLSNAVDTVNGPTAATGTVDTTIGNGTLYVVALLTADATPTAAEVKAGQKSGGAAAEFAGSQAVSGTGTQTLAGSALPTLLTPATGHKLAYMHESAAAVQSTVLVADGFTTAAVVVGSAEGGGASTTNPTTITTSIAVEIGDLIVANSSEQVGTAPTVTACTDNLSHTYSAPDADGIAQSTTSGMQFYQIATSAGTLTAVNFAATASANDIALKVAVYKGPFSSLDAAVVMRGDAASPYTGTSSGTLGQASCLAIGTLAGTSAGDTHAASAPWTLTGAIASGGARRAAQQYQNVEATTAVQPSFTGATDNAAIGTMVFRRSV